MSEKPRYLIQLGIEGFKKVRAALVELGDEPGLTLITGANGNGKSSVLDAIAALLTNARDLPPNPIHEGMEKAVIRGQLGDLIITRTITRKDGGKFTSTLKVESAEGARYDSPQGVLDGFLGTFAFSPLRFLQMPAKDQYLAMRGFVQGVDFDLMERLHRADFENRTDVNREAKRLKAVAEAIAFPPDTPKVKVSEDRLTRELEKAGAANAARERSLAAINEAGRRIREAETEIARLQKVIADSHEIIRTTTLADEIDTAALRLELSRARKINDAVELRKRRDEADAMWKVQDDKAEALTRSINERVATINAAIEATEMPYPGLTLRDNQVWLAGQPFEQASSAEQLRASIGIAMAENPQMRTILVREGSLMDSKSLKIVEGMAVERGYQCIVEKVDETGSIGIVMTDGMVESTPESRVAAKGKKKQ